MIYIMLAIALFTGGGTWMARGHWDAGEVASVKAAMEKERNDALTLAAAEKARGDEIANRFEGKLAKLRITNTTINREVMHEVEKTVYGDPNCDLPASGVMLINQSVREANRASGYVQTEMPTPARTPGPEQQGFNGGLVQPRQPSSSVVRGVRIAP